MASHHEKVRSAVAEMARTALPYADVRIGGKKPRAIAPGGSVLVGKPDPGEPEVLMSPLSYTYETAIPVSLAAYGAAFDTADAALDGMLTALGDAIEADRTLGGLCEFVDVRQSDADEAEADGAEAFNWADLVVICTYTTTKPLG